MFEEFFNQGDLEKHQKLPVSFLCDRETTAIAQSQPGFVNFIVAPLFATLSEAMPKLKLMLNQAKENAAKWQSYQETDKDKEIYSRFRKFEDQIAA